MCNPDTNAHTGIIPPHTHAHTRNTYLPLSPLSTRSLDLKLVLSLPLDPLLPLASRRQQLELRQYFNIINAYSVFSDSLAARRVSPYLSSIRSTNPATLPQLFAHSYHFVSNSFFLSAISLWNTLPGDVCKIHSLSAFFFGSSWITRLVLMNVLLSGVTRNNKFII